MFNIFGIQDDFKEYNGVIHDQRSPEEKQKDFFFDEVALSAPVKWYNKKGSFNRYPIFNQGTTSTCVPFAHAKALGIESFYKNGKFVDFSKRDSYSKRPNKPTLGTNNEWIMKYIVDNGLVLEQLMPFVNNESQMNNDDDRKPEDIVAAKIWKPANYLKLNPFSIEDIAFQLQNNNAVPLFFLADYKEWNSYFPTLRNGAIFDIRHDVCAVDYTIESGEKCIVIEDSWGLDTGVRGQRIISEKWFTEGRCRFAGVYRNLNELNQGQVDKPDYEFKNDLKFGDNNNEVMELQKKLNTIEDERGPLFPIIDKLGFYGGITMSGVRRFQRKYGLPDTGYFGPKSREVMNSL